MITALLAAVVVLAVALVIALIALVVSMRSGSQARDGDRFDELSGRIASSGEAQAREFERVERELRNDITETARVSRTELAGGFSQFQQTLAAQFTSMTSVQSGKIDGFAQQLVKLTETNAQQLDAVRQSLQLQAQQARDEQGVTLKRFGDTLTQQLAQMTEANDRRFAEVRATIEQRL